MQNKNGIIALTVIIGILCAYYLSFTLVSRNIQKKATEYATDATGKVSYDKKQAYLDSIWNEPVYSFLGIMDFTYKEIKNQELNLGLDLQGGMHVTLEVSPKEILIAMSGNNPDPRFRQALDEAGKLQAKKQDKFTSLFFSSFKELAPGTPLSQIFATSASKGRIDFNTSDDEVIRVIEEEVDGAIDRSFNIIRTRIDQFGVVQPNIQRIQGTGRIQIELPGVDNPERVRKLLQGVAKLEFVEVWELNEIGGYLSQVNDFLVKKAKAEKSLGGGKDTTSNQLITKDTAATVKGDTSLFANDNKTGDSTKTDTTAKKEAEVSDIFKLLQARDALIYQGKDTAKINRIFAMPEVKALLPPNVKFAWAVKPMDKKMQTDKKIDLLELYALKKNRNEAAPVTGEVVVDARQGFDDRGNPDVAMQMNAEGAKKWKKLTGANVGRRIAITLDNYVYSAPVVQGEIPSGSSSITGNFTIEEAKDLGNVLKAGKLPAPTRIVEDVIVGPTLGQEAQVQGIISMVAGMALVVVFMFVYYGKSGGVANIALGFNLFFIFGILAQLNAALTLPGIAGIVLTIGMSVDANVLIFERIREEMRRGAGLMKAIELGFDRAFWSIFDSNLTTLIIGIFLFMLGSGPVKGFAVTLMVGILSSFFTAVFISRVVIAILTKNGDASNLTFETGFSKNLLINVKFDFMAKRKTAYIASASIIGVGLLVMTIFGLNLGVDFKGGRSYVVKFAQAQPSTDIKVALTPTFPGAGVEVKTFGGADILKITTNYMVEDESEAADEKVQTALIQGLEAKTGLKYEINESVFGDGKFIIASTSKVGATIADDIKSSSFLAITLSLVAIFLYILMRFGKLQFSMGAIVALAHDALIVLGMVAIVTLLGLNIEIDQVFIAAILTVIGYSINDTVVVFDRVREYLKERNETNKGVALTKEEMTATLNNALSTTLSRTLMTSFTTIIVVVVLLLFGGEVLRGFSFALFIGIMFGTYSSLFIAVPIVADTTKFDEGQVEGVKPTPVTA